MKISARAVLLFLLFAGIASAAESPQEKIKVLVLTGGHGFKAEAFFKVFQDNPEIVYTTASHAGIPTQPATAYDRDDLFNFDVVVLYDSAINITDNQKARFLALFDKGIGVVILHHAYLSYPMWSEYERIAGGKYVYTEEQRKTGLTSSNYTRAMVEIPVTVAGEKHPVIDGLSDFVIRDELYTNMHMVGEVTPLLRTGADLLAWSRIEKSSRVVGTVLGHGPTAYEDPNFRKLLAQSIRWVATPASR
jgi:type 1 glutamine amidotransferase